MPTYAFQCKECDENYDEICSYDKTGKYNKVKCPVCGSKKKTKLMSSCAYAFGNDGHGVIGTGRWQSHDYRHKWNMNRPGGVNEQRRNAEKKSHVGPTPYRKIDDLNTDKNWGKVK